jgi:molecular chaperone GrpE (heat shock protein)
MANKFLPIILLCGISNISASNTMVSLTRNTMNPTEYMEKTERVINEVWGQNQNPDKIREAQERYERNEERELNDRCRESTERLCREIDQASGVSNFSSSNDTHDSQERERRVREDFDRDQERYERDVETARERAREDMRVYLDRLERDSK